jgi:hypothetical protein
VRSRLIIPHDGLHASALRALMHCFLDSHRVCSLSEFVDFFGSKSEHHSEKDRLSCHLDLTTGVLRSPQESPS